MATPATRIMLYKYGKSLALNNLLRSQLWPASNAIKNETQFIFNPKTDPERQVSNWDLVKDQSEVGFGFSGNVDAAILNRKSMVLGGFGEMVSSVEAAPRGGEGKIPYDDDDDDDGDDEFGSGEEVEGFEEDFDEDFEDSDEDGDGSEFDDEDDADVRRR